MDTGAEDDESAHGGALTAKQQRLLELRMRMNQCRKANNKEIANENQRIKDPSAAKWREAKRKKEEAEKKKTDDLEAEDPEEHKRARTLNMTAEQAEAELKRKAKKGQSSFGWEIFNEDSLYRAYKKRTKTNIHVDMDAYNAMKASDPDFFRTSDSLAHGVAAPLNVEAAHRMAFEIRQREKAKQQFSRRRPKVEDKDVDYINDRNQVFNKKIARAFDKYTIEIKQNLERGTALPEG